jgi:hypothetical protein
LCKKTRLRVFFPIAICAWSFFAAACAEPLGPGFFFLGRRTEIGARADLTRGAALHIRVVDFFKNAGNRPLQSIEVRLPEGPTFGSRNFHLTIDGRSVSPESASGADPRLMIAPLDPVWMRNQPREIVTEWDEIPEPGGRGTVAASEQAFYIADESALPLWQAPKGIFARGGPNPLTAMLTVIAPPDFLVLAPGRPFKPKLAGGQVSRRFRIRPTVDFIPYVVAGRYVEKKTSTRQGEVSFWTFHPVDAQQTETAAMRLASSMNAYAYFFGPATKTDSVVRIVEAPAELAAEFGEPGDGGGGSFPGGALLDHRALTQGLANESILELAEYELARTWFGWTVRSAPETQILMGRGVGLFGLVIAAERRSPDERRRMISLLLERYDESRRIAADRYLLEPPVGYSRAERISTGYRAALFFVRLEDLCGHDTLSAAFREIVRSRGGNTAADEELRAAIESEAKLDLAPTFRAWLNHPGVPDDFRARYGNSTGTRTQN